MLPEFITSCLLIFIAEMGDKSQILAMTFATKYSIRQVLLGVSLGAFFNHGIAVLLGSSIGKLISLNILRIGAGIVFIAFGIFALINTEEDDNYADTNHKFGPVLTVALAFFISELGDKTQLTAITLSSSAENPFIVLLGTVSGMIITSSLGIYVGSRMGRRIPEFSMKIISAFVFLTFGLVALFNNLPEYLLVPEYIFITIITFGLIAIILTRRAWIIHQQQPTTILKERAERLREQLMGIKNLIDGLCTSSRLCQRPDCNQCLIEVTQDNLDAHLNKNRNKQQKSLSSNWIERLEVNQRSFDIVKAREAYCLTVQACENCDCHHLEGCVLNSTRMALEKICFNKVLPFSGNIHDYLLQVEKESPVLATRIKRLIML